MSRASISRLPESPRAVPLAIGGASAATLAVAYAFQYVGGLAPCALCLYQRIPYGVVIVLAAATVIFAGLLGRRGVAAAALASALVFLAGAAIAGFHVGVEQHWWEGLSACGSGGADLSIEELKAQILAAPVVRCDEVLWSLLGISMAGYNFLASLAFAGASLWAARWLVAEDGS